MIAIEDAGDRQATNRPPVVARVIAGFHFSTISACLHLPTWWRLDTEDFGFFTGLQASVVMILNHAVTTFVCFPLEELVTFIYTIVFCCYYNLIFTLLLIFRCTFFSHIFLFI
jgi:ABC-type antimicrobial peptide transport system permease subunit